MSITLLPSRIGEAKRARILPFNVVQRTATVRTPVLMRSEGNCELNTVLDDVLSSYSDRFQNKFVAPISEGTLLVRISDRVLSRIIGLVFEGMWSAGLWRDGERDCLYPVVCRCLNGFGALLELTDDTMLLSKELMSELAKNDPVHSPELRGWQLLKARNILEQHGGRLNVFSPLWEEKTGTSIRLLLPLAASGIRRESNG